MPDWNELFDNTQNVLRDPDPLALELVTALTRPSQVLDHGCGGGRHLIPLARAGHQVTGLDIAPRGLKLSRERLAEHDLEASLVQADFRTPLAFPDASFDAVLSVKVVSHAGPEEIQVALDEVTRILRPGGLFWGSALSSKDARYGDGAEVAPDTFVHDRPPETGVTHHYFTEATLRRLLSGFGAVELSLTERIVSPEEPIFGQYAFRPGVAPVFCHWKFKAVK